MESAAPDPFQTVSVLISKSFILSTNEIGKLCLEYNLSADHSVSGLVFSGLFDRISKLRAHLLQRGASTSKKTVPALRYSYFCSDCPFKAKRVSVLAKHRLLHAKGKQPLKCSFCSFSTFSKSLLKHHINTVHKKGPDFHCNHCSFVCYNKRSLYNHERLKHNQAKEQQKIQTLIYSLEKSPSALILGSRQQIQEPAVTKHPSSTMVNCVQCAFTTGTQSKLMRHVRSVHENIRLERCNECSKSFSRKDSLRRHQQKVHLGIPSTHTCQQCAKQFQSASHLNEHMDVHSSVKKYLCSTCGRPFQSAASLRKHQRTIHLMPKAFVCESCDKQFNTQSALARHRKTQFHKDTLIIRQEQCNNDTTTAQTQPVQPVLLDLDLNLDLFEFI